jgi:hypothetical protein
VIGILRLNPAYATKSPFHNISLICSTRGARDRDLCANHRFVVSKLNDRSDNYSAVFALAVGAQLSPSVLPNVWATPTLGSHDVPILHQFSLILARTIGVNPFAETN